MSKKRKEKKNLYNENYGHIPIDFNERLEWMFDYHSLSKKKCEEIINKRDAMMNSLHYYNLNIVLFEEPEGAKRPRFRLINRKNFANQAIKNPNFVHVYIPNAKADHTHMRRLCEQELVELSNLICTPCMIEHRTYHKIPSSFSITDTFLSEIGLIRPVTKPDWDNIGKKYSDMANHNIWLDDSFVIRGVVDKFYSVLPRVEISIKYLNLIYNKYQYNNIVRRKDFNEYNCDLDWFK